ncbi:unnamed protein product [Ilex paraguariensis]|uniref:Uncharacterized protein n=1 Tax=Ilex paraguariensis TaxID=185542 RepID=A0ABC8T2B9_9AQUA
MYYRTGQQILLCGHQIEGGWAVEVSRAKLARKMRPENYDNSEGKSLQGEGVELYRLRTDIVLPFNSLDLIKGALPMTSNFPPAHPHP